MEDAIFPDPLEGQHDRDHDRLDGEDQGGNLRRVIMGEPVGTTVMA